MHAAIPPKFMADDSLSNDKNNRTFNFDEEEEEFEEVDAIIDSSSNIANENEHASNLSAQASASSGHPINTYTYDYNNANCNNFNKYNYNYKKANVSDLLNDKNSYFENETNEEQNKPLFYYFLEQQRTGRKIKPKQIPKTPPKRNQKKKEIIVDYSLYIDPNFDWNLASQKIPEGLRDDPPDEYNEVETYPKKSKNKSIMKHANKNKIFIGFPRNSIVRRALCGESMSQYPIEVSKCIITDLRVILEQAISLSMLDECAYIDKIIKNIKRSYNKSSLDVSEKSISSYDNDDSSSYAKNLPEKLEEAQTALDNRNQKWEAKKRIIESEKELQIEEIRLRYEEECKKLDRIWQTNKKKNLYNRPSTTLMKMRQQVKVQLSSHKFNDASHLAQQMFERDRKETEDASIRMQSAYREDCDRLRKKFEAEQQSIIESFDSKLASLKKKQDEDVLPFQSRVNKYSNSIEEKKVAAKRVGSISSLSFNSNKETINERPMTRSAIGRVKINGSLKLPPLKSLSKPPTYFNSKSSNSSQAHSRVGTASHRH